MIVGVDDIRRPGLSVTSFADITAKECLSVGRNSTGGFEVQFAVNLTADEARQVKVRCLTADTAAETLLRGIVAAHTTNADYLALLAPTTVQTLAHVTALTKEVQLLLRALAPID